LRGHHSSKPEKKWSAVQKENRAVFVVARGPASKSDPAQLDLDAQAVGRDGRDKFVLDPHLDHSRHDAIFCSVKE
jgi:hypothetical protein